jgi:hypothetical protein
VDDGKWKSVKRDIRELHERSKKDIPLLRLWYTETPMFLSLWTADQYQLSVSRSEIIEVPDVVALNSVLVEEQYHPDKLLLRYGPGS